MSISKIIEEEAKKNGADKAKLIKIDKIDISDFIESIKKYPLDFAYLKREIKKREYPKNFVEEAESVLLCFYKYWDKNGNYEELISKIKDPYNFLSANGRKKIDFINKIKKDKFKISRYALGYDYHKLIQNKLYATLSNLKKIIKDIDGKIFVDTSPVLEKKLAILSHMAFRGKNTLAINEDIGSYFFIGGIFLNIKAGEILGSDEFSLCNNCELCVKACPTGALSPYNLNPSKCISYWTTHNFKGNDIPENILNSSDYIYGCDICQEVCPYNRK
jgi:epoxyqueuosine reductase QueG